MQYEVSAMPQLYYNYPLILAENAIRCYETQTTIDKSPYNSENH